MKTFFFSLFVFSFSIAGFAQDSTSTDKKTSNWTKKNTILFNLEHTYYNNWSQGGLSSFSFGATYKGFFNYAKNNHLWNNSIELAYGKIKQDANNKGLRDPGNLFRKNDDKIEITSSYGLKAFSDWNYNASLNLKSQFDEGFNKDAELVASFFSPAYLTSALGMELKRPSFYVLLSCLTGRVTYVGDERLAVPGKFGFTTEGQHWHFGLGSMVKLYYQKDIFENVNLLSKLEFFYDYQKSIGETDISWEVFVLMKVNAWLTAFINTQLLLDKDFSHQVQFKQRFGIAIPLTF